MIFQKIDDFDSSGEQLPQRLNLPTAKFQK